MSGADEAGLIGVIADQLNLELVVFGLEQHLGASNRKLADAARTKAAADDDGLGVAPARYFEEALDHRGESLGELLDRAVDDAAGFRIPFGQQLIELLLGELL